MSPAASEQVWQPPALGELLRWGLPAQNTLDAWVVRALALLARQQVLTVSGLDHIRAVHDPFIVAINHSTRTESLLVPALMVLYRGGRLVHFFADWNFRLIPGIGLIYRRAQTITVTRKSAKPAFLNVLKPLYMKPPGALNGARLYLEAGHSVGIFPEAAGRIGDHARMEVEIGAALAPPRPNGRRPTRAELTRWHATLMGEISRLAGKAWGPEITTGGQP